MRVANRAFRALRMARSADLTRSGGRFLEISDSDAGDALLDGGLAAFRNTVLSSDTWGNLIPDAYLASIALSHAVPVASFDRDFRRFDGLEITVPGA